MVSLGRLAGLIAMAGLIVTEYACEPVAPTESVPVIVKLNVLTTVGAPLMAPVLALRLKPLGRAPAETLNLIVPVPPLALTVWLYGLLTVSLGRLAGLIAMAALIVTEYACDPVAPTESVPVTVKLKVLTTVGEPLMAPVLALRLNPLGRAPAETLNVIAPVPPLALTVWL